MPAPRKRIADTSKKSATTPTNDVAAIDYRGGAVPAWVKEIIETHLAIESEDARSAGELGYMARALVLATMPYKDPKSDVFRRENGDFTLRIVAGYEGGIPFGVYPRLLMSWVATEAVRTKSPDIELGDSLSVFLRDVLDIQRGGGKRGSNTRVAEQMKRLFGSLITAQYTGGMSGRGFTLRNVMIAEGLDLDDGFEESLHLEPDNAPAAHHQGPPSSPLWTPQEREIAGAWKSRVRLSDGFFRECVTKPVPIDLRLATRRARLQESLSQGAQGRSDRLPRRQHRGCRQGPRPPALPPPCLEANSAFLTGGVMKNSQARIRPCRCG